MLPYNTEKFRVMNSKQRLIMEMMKKGQGGNGRTTNQNPLDMSG